MLTAIYIAAVVACLFNLGAELRRCLMMYQQNSYRRERYLGWLKESGDSVSGWHLCGLIVFFIPLVWFCPAKAGIVLVGIFGILSGLSLVSRKYKHPVVMTNRAWRIYITFWFIAAVAGAVSVLLFGKFELLPGLFALAEGLMACYCASHIIIQLAGFILQPLENRINRKYYDEAEAIIRSMPDLKIIGITGSYGKTTTKHYLNAILSEQFETLMTPGSYNTTLGVIRTIREMLKPYHEVFIVEMGAKNIGDIKEICDLVHPRAGIITAVGPQHLKSFKTIENVQRTKFELADSLPATGLVVVNNDFEKIADRPVGNARCVRYAVTNPEGADYVARDIEYSAAGSHFTVVRRADGHEIKLVTRLVGECNISNITAAVAMALEMGMDDRKIAFAVENIEQVEHRLSIKRVPGGLTILDDAFNSNPVGSAMALDVLSAMNTGRRFLITPGMIELGSEQQELNRKFGAKAASCCDIAVVVGKYNRDAIIEGLKEGGMPEGRIRIVDTFGEAQAILTSMATAGDVVLYENDLPDTFK